MRERVNSEVERVVSRGEPSRKVWGEEAREDVSGESRPKNGEPIDRSTAVCPSLGDPAVLSTDPRPRKGDPKHLSKDPCRLGLFLSSRICVPLGRSCTG